MTIHDLIMFATGVCWGIFIIKPIWDLAVKIYKNAKGLE